MMLVRLRGLWVIFWLKNQLKIYPLFLLTQTIIRIIILPGGDHYTMKQLHNVVVSIPRLFRRGDIPVSIFMSWASEILQEFHKGEQPEALDTKNSITLVQKNDNE